MLVSKQNWLTLLIKVFDILQFISDISHRFNVLPQIKNIRNKRCWNTTPAVFYLNLNVLLDFHSWISEILENTATHFNPIMLISHIYALILKKNNISGIFTPHHLKGHLTFLDQRDIPSSLSVMWRFGSGVIPGSLCTDAQIASFYLYLSLRPECHRREERHENWNHENCTLPTIHPGRRLSIHHTNHKYHAWNTGKVYRVANFWVGYLDLVCSDIFFSCFGFSDFWLSEFCL